MSTVYISISKSIVFLSMRNAIRNVVNNPLFLCNQVGDAGPVLDMMAVILENLTSTVSVSRSTVSAVYRTAQIIASVPNLSYQNKVSQHDKCSFCCYRLVDRL